MAKNKKYIITHSNYTVKKKHKHLNDDRVVYERDFTVTNGNNIWSNSDSPYSYGSFKMVRNVKNSGKYRYNSGEWLKHNSCGDNPEIWTYNCLPNRDSNDDSKINILPNYNSLLDFAYYRSCKDLIQTSINNILNNFPAEIYFSENNYEFEDGTEVYLLDNPFNIELITNTNDGNVLRNFSKSYDKYTVINNNSNNQLNVIKKYNKEEFIRIQCADEEDLLYIITLVTENNDEIEIYCYFIDGKVLYTFEKKELIGTRIRPLNKYINNFFDNLDEFQKIVLNKNTAPLYTMYLDYPQETDKGVEIFKKRFTLPVIYDWNIDINSGEYEIYIKELLKLCDFYDNRRTNNLWRIMTHDSIKNMDYAFKNDKIDDDEYGLGESQFEKIIKCYAKQFDDIKRYIDNIKTTNIISYNNNNNAPTYFLSDKLELGGWEVYNISNSLDNKKNVNANKLFDNINKIFNANDVNIELMRNLQINSKEILSHKGTKHGIEMLLALFGLTSYDFNKDKYDYKITEYVNTVTDNEKINSDEVIFYNRLKNNFNEVYPNDFSVINDPLQNLPLRLVKYNFNGDNEGEYLIPWFDKNQKLDGDIYFQMYGGWCKLFKKDLNDSTNFDDDVVFDEKIKIYDETIKYLLIVKNISQLKNVNKDKLYDGCIVYVSNINDFNEIYINDNKKTISLNGGNDNLKASHYFILDNIKNFYTIGSYVDSNGNFVYGWENIPEIEIEQSSINPLFERGLKVKLLENVIEDHKGNNPHGGYGKYDDGETFVDYFKQIFKYSIENNNFNNTLYDCENGEIDKNIKDIGFSIEKQMDNVKTWYFSDANNIIDESIGGLKELTLEKTKKDDGVTIYNGVEYDVNNAYTLSYVSKKQNNINVGKENNDTFFDSDLIPFDFENIGNKYNESTANSIINDKKLIIEFSGSIIRYEKDFPLFLQMAILPYLKQIIPSTTILEIRIEGGYAGYTTLPFVKSNIETEN